ncbi:AAA domain-containing protein [Sulfuricurvum sp.]|uniref:DEAD/DEAH box helicase n=1 Tax=Sulfuricurvum sp. TaxID=2025608 RepID=UPI002627604C|nr:AAA domain-containing protein [Sulfuricurvum sp.]MDD2780962.1 AAA domain-containing protein [Sulfuricurvum sp.]
MQNRKYFKYKISELEDIYENSINDYGVLEELEEELMHRSTQSARKLLHKIQNILSTEQSLIPFDEVNFSNSTATTIAFPIIQKNKYDPENLEEEKPIDWNKVLSSNKDIIASFGDKEPNIKPIDIRPENILDTWMAIEALSPQSYKTPNDLIIGQGSVCYLKSGQEPWNLGEKSKPNNNLYYLVYLGAIGLEKATIQLLSKYQDKHIERQQSKGLASLGVVLLNKNGIPLPDTGLAISSFGWAYMMAMQGKLSELKYWEIAEKHLKNGLEKIIYQKDDEGQLLPFSLNKAVEAFNWITQNYYLSQGECTPPTFAIRLYQPFSKGEPETPLLNSFYLNDLQRAKQTIETGKCGKALSQYLGILKPESTHDILKDKIYIEKALEPIKTPLARWPGKGNHSLVLLQQASVNIALDELRSEGLFSVNGPPGTGKTTLLRDIVAAVLLERSKILLKFKDAEDAFDYAGKMKLGNNFIHLYKLNESLSGHEILVASSNNKAVENISKELPRKSQIAENIEELNFFKTLSDQLSGEGEDTETWGIIAAVLGNSKNRSAFIDKAWWDDNSSLKKYFKYITGQLNFDIDENGKEIIPKIIEECDPPKNLVEAKARWEKAKEEFSKTLNAAANMTALAQSAYENYHLISRLKINIANNQAKQIQLLESIKLAKVNNENLKIVLKQSEVSLNIEQEKEKLSLSRKPNFLVRIFMRSQWQIWKDDYQHIYSKFLEHRDNYNQLLMQSQNAIKKLENLESEYIKCQSDEKVFENELSEAISKLEKYSEICGGKLVTPDLWLLSHEEQQTFTPNFTDKVQRLRDDVFVASIKLHKAFIDASSQKLRQNMAAFFSCLSGSSLPHDKQQLLPDLWSSAFLVVPVMSTTFASVGRMLKELPKESFGWLLIDEAGQASPQEAIGAIFKAKRVLSVGDPLQIEPVVTLPSSIIEGISKHLGVDPTEWTAPDASVQILSDKSNIYGATIPRDLSEIRIGTPLLVHRRCENPMFSISNKLAYCGLMVHATITKKSDITELFGVQTFWFDVRGGVEEKWCPEEGEQVCNMLLKAIEYFAGDPDIFVITPFKIVAERMRRRMEHEQERLLNFGISNPSDWIKNNIGTVHTFQGKEAKAVILLLGAPCPTQNGARSWATNNVNLLNVAVSRSKQNFYIVGNRELWEGIGNMKLVSQYI